MKSYHFVAILIILNLLIGLIGSKEKIVLLISAVVLVAIILLVPKIISRFVHPAG